MKAKSILIVCILFCSVISMKATLDCYGAFSIAATHARQQFAGHMQDCYSLLGAAWSFITSDYVSATISFIEGGRCQWEAYANYHSTLDALDFIWCRCMEFTGC
jgi:hypothetical protein